MNFFHLIEGEGAIIRSKGTFKQVDLYERAGGLYAKVGSGYVRLMENNKTSVPTVFWDEMSVKAKVGQFGRLRFK